MTHLGAATVKKRWMESDVFFALAVTACFFLLNGAMLLTHEPWRDEAQAWLITKDLSLLGILRQAQYEGHPILWNLVLLPFAKLGFPYRWIGLISVALVTGAVWLLVRYAPFSKTIRLLCVTGAYLMYYTPVIARNYALIPLILFGIACWYPTRNKKPIRYAVLIFLLMQTHIMMAGTAGMLALFFLWEEWGVVRAGGQDKRKALTAMFIPPAGVAALVLQLYGSIGANKMISSSLPSLGKPVVALRAFVDAVDELLYMVTNWPVIQQLGLLAQCAVVVAIFAALLLWLIKADRKQPVLIFAAGFLYQMLLFAFVWFATIQRIVSVEILLPFCIWLAYAPEENGPPAKRTEAVALPRPAVGAGFAAVALILLSAVSWNGLVGDIAFDRQAAYNNTGSAEAYAYIRENLPDDALLVFQKEDTMSALAAYFPYGTSYNSNRHSFTRYTVWDDQYRHENTIGEILDELADIPGSDAKPVYLVTDIADSADYPKDRVKLLGAWGVPGGEDYALFQVTKEAK